MQTSLCIRGVCSCSGSNLGCHLISLTNHFRLCNKTLRYLQKQSFQKQILVPGESLYIGISNNVADNFSLLLLDDLTAKYYECKFVKRAIQVSARFLDPLVFLTCVMGGIPTCSVKL